MNSVYDSIDARDGEHSFRSMGKMVYLTISDIKASLSCSFLHRVNGKTDYK